MTTNSQADQKSTEDLSLTLAAEYAVEYAKQQGMDESEVSLHRGTGVSVTARQQELESVEKHNDAQLVVSVYKDQKTGSASSADLSRTGIRSSVDAAISIARFTGADECLGLADAERMASDKKDLGLHCGWQKSVAELVELAKECEQAALQTSDLISNSEGASVNTYAGSAVYANSHGFVSDVAGSQHSVLSASKLAQCSETIGTTAIVIQQSLLVLNPLAAVPPSEPLLVWGPARLPHVRPPLFTMPASLKLW